MSRAWKDMTPDPDGKPTGDSGKDVDPTKADKGIPDPQTKVPVEPDELRSKDLSPGKVNLARDQKPLTSLPQPDETDTARPAKVRIH